MNNNNNNKQLKEGRSKENKSRLKDAKLVGVPFSTIQGQP